MSRLGACLLALVLSVIAAAPAFALDCANPKTTAEKSACVEQSLRDADRTIDAVYQAARAKLDDVGKKRLRDEQLAWLNVRNVLCGIDSGKGDREAWLRTILKDPAKAACVTRTTLERADQLSRSTATASAPSLPAPSVPPAAASTAAPVPSLPSTTVVPAQTVSPLQAAPALSPSRAQLSQQAPNPYAQTGYPSRGSLSGSLDMVAHELAQFDTGILIVGAALSVALIVATLFGLWGIAAIAAVFGGIICAINSGFPQPVGPFFLGLGLLALLLVVMRLVIHRTLYPLGMRKLVRGLPLVAIASAVITLIFLQAVEIFQGGGFRIEAFVFDSIVVGIVQLIIGYAVVVPAFRWRERRAVAKPVEGADVALAAAAAVPASDRAVASTGGDEVTRPRPASPALGTGFAEANRDVPHTKFQWTEDGFTVSFSTTGKWLFIIGNSFSSMGGQGGNIIAAVMMIMLLLAMFVIVIAWYIIDALIKTTIVVDRESITVAGRRMRRADFGGFHVYRTISVGNKRGSILGYNYGTQSFAFGGVWHEGAATEVAAGLNRVLRIAPTAVDECRVSAEELRSARPSEF